LIRHTLAVIALFRRKITAKSLPHAGTWARS